MKIEGFQGSQYFQIISSLYHVSGRIEAAFSYYRQQSVTLRGYTKRERKAERKKKKKERKGEKEREGKGRESFLILF